MILIIDHHDSFTFNLYQAIAEMTPDVKVVRVDRVDLAEIERMGPKGIVLSPGPGRPEEISIEIIQKFGKNIPILGVCLGHQAIGLAFGGRVNGSPEILHGKKSLVFHTRQKLFKGMPLPFYAARYHSLLVEKEGLPEELTIDAETPEGLIMALSHKTHPIFGVQFHPESILTPEGKTILHNFVEMCR